MDIALLPLMPKYLFQINDGEAHDSTWVDLPHIIVARMEAARLTAELVRDDSQSLWCDGLCEVRVYDEGGLQLFQITIVWTDAPAAGILQG